jgi:methylthioribose-1-phosphate isomerase
MNFQTISWNQETASIFFIDQTLLPAERKIVRCSTVERLATAIRRLEIRGAPALGVAGGYGIALAATYSTAGNMNEFAAELEEAALILRETRPTAVNLGWGIDRVLSAASSASTPEEAILQAVSEAERIALEDRKLCHSIGRNGAHLLPNECTILTHCNAGALACVEWGTALGVIRSAVEMGKSLDVIACETRPLHQGSRLTAWELVEDGINVQVITDSSAAHLMRSGVVDAVIVGADRICRDVVFNKIGTYMHAVCAHHHNIPFYVAAPYSTFDITRTEKDVPIEQRGKDEIAFCGNHQLIPNGVPALNYAFDATPLDLITAIITERGVLYPPYSLEDSMS